MAKLFLFVLLALVVGQSGQTSADYVVNEQEEGAPIAGLPSMTASQVMLSEPSMETGPPYAVSGYSSETLADSQQPDMSRLVRLYKVTGLRPAQSKKRLFATGNRQPFVEMDDPYTKVLGFNKWGADARLEGSDNHLSSKKASDQSYALSRGSLRKLLEATRERLGMARKKKSRCVADDSRGVKNPSFCDMDAYFGAAGYRSDLWDSAGRR